MSSKASGNTIVLTCAVLTLLLGPAALFSQVTSASASPVIGNEFPVVMKQNVAAGKTPLETKVQAKLAVATLVNGVVIPRDAVLSGEVIESTAKSKDDPSRLAIRLDSAEWKNGTAKIKVYLTAWYYPVATMMNQDLSYEPPDAARGGKKDWNGMGTYPDPNNPISQGRFPGRDTDKDSGTTAPATTASNISKHRVVMKDVESTRNNDGGFTVTSTRSNIKLDKVTTYVFATDDLSPKPY
jgi:hypothetical protein